MKDIKKIFNELTEEIENGLGDWDGIPETEEDKTFKEKYGTE